MFKIKPIFIIFLVLSMGFSPAAVSAFEFKSQKKLSAEEFEKRLTKYASAPPELRIYIPDMVKSDESLSYEDCYNVSQKLKPLLVDENKSKSDNSQEQTYAKTYNTVVYQAAKHLAQIEVDNPSRAVHDYYTAYYPTGHFPDNYINMHAFTEAAEFMRDWAAKNLAYMGESNAPDINPNTRINTPLGPMTEKDFLMFINGAELTYEGNFKSTDINGKISLMAVDSVGKILNDNFLCIRGLEDLDFVNMKLHQSGLPQIKRPAMDYLSGDERRQYELYILIDKNDPRWNNAVIQEQIAAGKIQNAEPRQIMPNGEPVDITPGTIRKIQVTNKMIPSVKDPTGADITDPNLLPGTKENEELFKIKEFKQATLDNIMYGEAVGTLVFAIIMLIVNFIYR
jgi:hypothetical protein